MSNVKSQMKWVVKHFSSLILILLVAAAGMAYFTSQISMTSFATIAFVVVTAVLVLAYYGLMNVKSSLVFALIASVLLVAVGYSKHPSVDGGKFQAVTLTSGQTYFGHLTKLDSGNPVLTDVYTLQAAPATSTTAKTSTSTASKPILVKLSSEIHSPEDQMTIKGDKIMFWENLQDSSKVVQAIKKDQNTK